MSKRGQKIRRAIFIVLATFLVLPFLMAGLNQNPALAVVNKLSELKSTPDKFGSVDCSFEVIGKKGNFLTGYKRDYSVSCTWEKSQTDGARYALFYNQATGNKIEPVCFPSTDKIESLDDNKARECLYTDESKMVFVERITGQNANQLDSAMENVLKDWGLQVAYYDNTPQNLTYSQLNELSDEEKESITKLQDLYSKIVEDTRAVQTAEELKNISTADTEAFMAERDRWKPSSKDFCYFVKNGDEAKDKDGNEISQERVDACTKATTEISNMQTVVLLAQTAINSSCSGALSDCSEYTAFVQKSEEIEELLELKGEQSLSKDPLGPGANKNTCPPSYNFFTLFSGKHDVFVSIGCWFLSLLLAIKRFIFGWINPELLSKVLLVYGVTEGNNQVVEVWGTIRNIINIGFLLSFLAMALLNIVGYDLKTWQFRRMIPAIVGAILLVNFSLAICNFIILFMNVLTNFFLFGEPNATSSSASLDSLFGLGKETIDQLADKTFGAALVQVILSWAFSIILLYLYLLLWVRVIVLNILFMFSAIPYLANVAPVKAIKEQTGKWWDMFMKWAMMGPMVALLLYVAAKTIAVAGLEVAPLPDAEYTSDTPRLLQLITAGVILYIAATYPMKAGGDIMKAVSEYASGKKGPLGSATAKSLKKAAGARLKGQRQKVASMDLDKTFKDDQGNLKDSSGWGKLKYGLARVAKKGTSAGLTIQNAPKMIEENAERFQKEQEKAFGKASSRGAFTKWAKRASELEIKEEAQKKADQGVAASALYNTLMNDKSDKERAIALKALQMLSNGEKGARRQEEARGFFQSLGVSREDRITMDSVEKMKRQSKFAGEEGFDKPEKYKPVPEGFNPVEEAEKLLTTMPRQQASSMDTGLLESKQWGYLAQASARNKSDMFAQDGTIDQFLMNLKNGISQDAKDAIKRTMMSGDQDEINKVLSENGIDVKLDMSDANLEMPPGDNAGDLAKIMKNVNIRSNLDQIFARRKNDVQLQAASRLKGFLDNPSVLQMYGGNEQGLYTKITNDMQGITNDLQNNFSEAIRKAKEVFAPQFAGRETDQIDPEEIRMQIDATTRAIDWAREGILKKNIGTLASGKAVQEKTASKKKEPPSQGQPTSGIYYGP
ncbi:hypothetical protein HYV44_01755 [Candidatus Microgenomates bacterium]|nr:hypothetical protein [Candidatus Microgenomates bacterium]